MGGWLSDWQDSGLCSCLIIWLVVPATVADPENRLWLPYTVCPEVITILQWNVGEVCYIHIIKRYRHTHTLIASLNVLSASLNKTFPSSFFHIIVNKMC